MPTFAYKALSVQGHDVAGRLEAVDQASAVRELAARGASVIDIVEDATTNGSAVGRLGPGPRLRVRPRQLGILTRQLAIALEAGLPLMAALDVMRRELDHGPSRELLAQLGQRVQAGASLSDALAEYPSIFSLMYVRLVRVGETGGMLEAVLAQLADMLERQHELRERVKSASIYPAILLLLGVASVAVIVTVIVPRIIETITMEGALLPWPTRVLTGASALVGAWWWLLAPGVLAAGLAWRQLVLRGPGRAWWDGVQLRTPVLGRLIRQIEAARFARSLGILARGGVSITEAMAVVRDVIQNTPMRLAVHRLAESIKSGEPVAGPLQRSGLFPPLLVQMVHVGENTGRLDEMLLRAASVHETEARVALDRLVSVLPVLMILALAVVIGFIVAGLVLAIVTFQSTGFGALEG